MNRVLRGTATGLPLVLIGMLFASDTLVATLSVADSATHSTPQMASASSAETEAVALQIDTQPEAATSPPRLGTVSGSSGVYPKADRDSVGSIELRATESVVVYDEAKQSELVDGPSSAGAVEPWFGVLQPSEEAISHLRNAGIQVTTLEIAWDRYEPYPGVFDQAYIAETRRWYADLQAAGFRVVLDSGLQYPPSWVFELDDHTRFVNQYGDEYHGGIGDDVPNAVFNMSVRKAQANYLHQVSADLIDLEFIAIRVGGLGFGELRYPNPGYENNLNSYWAFDANAQAKSPTPGWKPGDPDVVDAAVFIDWYLQSLGDYGKWLADTTRSEFPRTPNLHVLLPSWGIRPGEVEEAAAARLDGTSRGEQRWTINQGVDWSRQLPLLASVPGTMVSTTWLDAADQGAASGDESPVAYLVRLAKPLGISVLGENTGNNTANEVRRAVGHVRRLGLVGMLWMHPPGFRADGLASLTDYTAFIGGNG